jgi:hypothetical protein
MRHFIHTCHTSSTCSFQSDTWTLKVLSAAGVCTGPRRLANWTVFYVCYCWCLKEHSLRETSRNDSCVITIVGYHGNSVYRVVALIPIWVTVTSLAIWQPTGGPKVGSHKSNAPIHPIFLEMYNAHSVIFPWESTLDITGCCTTLPTEQGAGSKR